MNVIEARDISMSYEGKTVIDKVSFDVKKGEILGVIGKNGSGKSTTLRAIAGIFSPDGGSIDLQVPHIAPGLWGLHGDYAQSHYSGNLRATLQGICSGHWKGGLQLTDFTMANQPGPAINCAGNLTITGGSVTDNAYTGKSDYGTIHVNNKESVVSITGGTFANNRAYSGGVLYTAPAKEVRIENVTFENNRASYNGGAVAIYALNCPTTVT